MDINFLVPLIVYVLLNLVYIFASKALQLGPKFRLATVLGAYVLIGGWLYLSTTIDRVIVNTALAMLSISLARVMQTSVRTPDLPKVKDLIFLAALALAFVFGVLTRTTIGAFAWLLFLVVVTWFSLSQSTLQRQVSGEYKDEAEMPEIYGKWFYLIGKFSFLYLAIALCGLGTNTLPLPKFIFIMLIPLGLITVFAAYAMDMYRNKGKNDGSLTSFGAGSVLAGFLLIVLGIFVPFFY